MATEIGTVGNKTFYADIQMIGLGWRGIRVEVTTIGSRSPMVYTWDLGKVRDRAHAEDLVAEHVIRLRRLEDVHAGSIPSSKGSGNE